MRTVLSTIHSKYIHPSLALPYLAAFCKDACGEVSIREFTLQEPKPNILARLLAENPDNVGFSVYLWNRVMTLELVDALHAARPDLRIIIGGPEVSFDDEALFVRHPGLTALVSGEGEEPLSNLLRAWSAGRHPDDLTGLILRLDDNVLTGPDPRPLNTLDDIPSPFRQGGIDLNRGYVYYETSRGCPFQCAFCLSARDNRVRSFSMERIEHDLLWLMERGVSQVKLIDRTFNYNRERARTIFSLILKHNRQTRFHFEIAADLLDEETLLLLEKVPEGMFQFEIGVQSTAPQTLDRINRSVDLGKLYGNISALQQRTGVHLHLDLVSGLPGDTYQQVLSGIDRLLELKPDHLQLEPVKLIPGSPLREKANQFRLSHDPNPPYSVLHTPEIDFASLERLRTISRLLDLTWNAGRFATLFSTLRRLAPLSEHLDSLVDFIEQRDLLRHPINQSELFTLVWDWLRGSFPETTLPRLRDSLGRDFALAERVLPNRIPPFLQGEFTNEELESVSRRVDERRSELRGTGVKVQYFATTFSDLPPTPGRQTRIFFYLHRSGQGLEIEEHILPP